VVSFFGLVGSIVGGLSGEIPGAVIGVGICAVIGGGLLGLTGATLGGRVGYLGYLVVQNAPAYEFKIKPFNDSEILTKRLHTGGIRVNTSVRILEKIGKLFIKKIK